MRKFLLLGFLSFLIAIVVLPATLLSAQGTTFTYNDNGRRDPFWPLISPSGTILIYDSNVVFSDMILEGIIYDPKGEKLAIINTKVVKATDNIGGFLVVSIEPDYVVLSKDGQEFTLRSKKEK
jgi:hypothetical protein